ncbi:MAG: tRNA(fMet)-specific endonuclease VapC [Acidobacteriota bacterium]|jgi:predicted nucleic acid-binding protein|nr:tRNA(fMet)-specific endonuclease VapC [Acidobacteriota bacterium]
MAADIVVVDTNVVSYLFKKDTRGELYQSVLDGKLLMIAAQTLAELELMPLVNNWGKKRHAALRSDLKKYIIVETNETVCLFWAEIQANATKKGRPISVGDAWIAATAVAYDVPLVTHNPDDFKNVPNLIIITEKKVA